MLVGDVSAQEADTMQMMHAQSTNAKQQTPTATVPSAEHHMWQESDDDLKRGFQGVWQAQV